MSFSGLRQSMALEIRTRAVVSYRESDRKTFLVLSWPTVACKGSRVCSLWGNAPNRSFRLEAIPQLKMEQQSLECSASESLPSVSESSGVTPVQPRLQSEL